MTVTVSSAPLTSPPNKYGGDPVAFDAAMQAHLTWQADTLVTELNAQNAENNSLATTATTQADLAAAQAIAAAASAATATTQAALAATNTNAPVWVSGTTYTLGQVVYSNTNYRTYRRIVAGAGTTDPASDVTNWAMQTLSIETGLPTVRPSLNLDFANSQSVDPRITFTRASTATRTNSKGLIEAVASGVPRIDFDPVTLECKGLLIEEARTNLLTYSDAFDNAAWAKTRSTINANATTAPDGTVAADKLIEDTTASNSHVITSYNSGVSPNQTLTYSLFLKAGERGIVKVLIWDNDAAANQVSAYFNLNTGTVGTVGASGNGSQQSASITPYGGGWYRCTVTGKPNTSGSNSGTAVYISLDGPTSTYTGDGTSGLYIWGAQLEAGAFPTSYIPTTTAQVTRAADVAVMTGANFSSWYRADEGTIVVGFDMVSINDAGTRVIFGAGVTGTYGESMFLSRNPGSSNITMSIIDGGVSQHSGTALGAVATNTQFSAACSYKLNDCAASGNGATVVADAAATINSADRLSVGCSPWGSDATLCGHLHSLRYYPTRVSNAALQALSTQ